MYLAYLRPNHRLSLKTPQEEFSMCLTRGFGNRRIWLDGFFAGILTLALVGLSACATHRGDPPKCKGTFTPINPSSSVVANGSQR